MTRFTARTACWSAAQFSIARPVLLTSLALFTTTNIGCQNGQWGGRPAVVPPPGGMLNRPDAYYTPPTVSPGTPLGAQPTSPRSSISLAPGATNTTSNPASSANRSPSQNTYDVASRVPADSQPIRVLDSTNRGTASVATSGGMPVHDGTNASGWRNGLPPASVSSNPFGGLRGTTGGVRSASQGFSGQDGQWRSRSSYEATERR